MANLDSKAKRASSVAISLYPMAPGHAFATNGLSDAERQVVGYGYFGIAADAPAEVDAVATRFSLLIPLMSLLNMFRGN